MNNYLKYGFYNPGTYSSDSTTTKLYLGQIDGKFTSTDNIFQKIYEKYDSQGRDYGGYKKILEDIERLKITINGYYINKNGNTIFISGHQLRIKNNQNELVLGNNMKLNYSGNPEETIITIYDPRGIYEFDSLINFHYKGNTLGNDSLYLLGDDEGSVVGIDATIDFLYSLSSETYENRQIGEYKITKGIAQQYGEVDPGTSIYNLIYYKHYVDSETTFKYLNNILGIEIEASPHTVFAIKDESDMEMQYHEINDTGILDLYELTNIKDIKYIGKRYLKTPYDDSTLSEEIITEDVFDDNNHYILNASADVSVTYIFTDVQGTYKIEA